MYETFSEWPTVPYSQWGLHLSLEKTSNFRSPYQAKPKVVEDAWTQSGLAKMFDKNTQIAAVEMNARGELFKGDNPQLEEEEGLEDAEDEEDLPLEDIQNMVKDIRMG